MGTNLEQIDTALCRLKESAQHDPRDEIYTTTTSAPVMLVPTLQPTDELGHSALSHYCSDLQTVTKKLGYLYQCPAGVSEEAVSWVCKMIRTFKNECTFVKFAAEALHRFCTPALMFEASLRAEDVGKTVERTDEEKREAMRKVRQRCVVLRNHDMYEFIAELIASPDVYEKKNFTRGLLSCIQAVCADPAGSHELGSMPAVVETVHNIVRENYKVDIPLMVEAVRTLGVLICKATLETMVDCGAVVTIVNLLQYRQDMKADVIAATANTIEPLCDHVVTCRTVMEANGVFLLLRAVGSVRDTIAATSVIYRCLKKLCLMVDQCARDLRKHNGLQVLVTSISAIAHAEELNTPVLVDLLDCVAIVCDIANASGTLIYSGQTLLFDIVRKHSLNQDVLIAATNVILICMRDAEAKRLITTLSFNIVVETMERFETRPAIVTLVCDVLNMLSDNPEFCTILSKEPSKCMVRILKKYKHDSRLCGIIAMCCVNLAANIRDSVVRNFLPPLIESALLNPDDRELRSSLARLMIVVSKCEQDRRMIQEWGGLDIVIQRAVDEEDPEADELTLRSLLMFVLNAKLKAVFVERGIVPVLVRIRMNIDAVGGGSDPARADALRRLLVELLQSLIVDELAEEAILKTDLHELLLGWPSRRANAAPSLMVQLEPSQPAAAPPQDALRRKKRALENEMCAVALAAERQAVEHHHTAHAASVCLAEHAREGEYIMLAEQQAYSAIHRNMLQWLAMAEHRAMTLLADTMHGEAAQRIAIASTAAADSDRMVAGHLCTLRTRIGVLHAVSLAEDERRCRLEMATGWRRGAAALHRQFIVLPDVACIIQRAGRGWLSRAAVWGMRIAERAAVAAAALVRAQREATLAFLGAEVAARGEITAFEARMAGTLCVPWRSEVWGGGGSSARRARGERVREATGAEVELLGDYEHGRWGIMHAEAAARRGFEVPLDEVSARGAILTAECRGIASILQREDIAWVGIAVGPIQRWARRWLARRTVAHRRALVELARLKELWYHGALEVAREEEAHRHDLRLPACPWRLLPYAPSLRSVSDAVRRMFHIPTSTPLRALRWVLLPAPDAARVTAAEQSARAVARQCEGVERVSLRRWFERAAKCRKNVTELPLVTQAAEDDGAATDDSAPKEDEGEGEDDPQVWPLLLDAEVSTKISSNEEAHRFRVGVHEQSARRDVALACAESATRAREAAQRRWEQRWMRTPDTPSPTSSPRGSASPPSPDAAPTDVRVQMEQIYSETAALMEGLPITAAPTRPQQRVSFSVD